MNPTNIATRRAVLKGLGTLSALAVTIAPVLGEDTSPELRKLAERYADAYARSLATDEAAATATEAFDATVKAARLRIPMWGKRGGMRGSMLTLEGDTSPAWVRQHIADEFQRRADSAQRARERQPDMAKWLASPEDEFSARAEVQAKAEPVLAEYQRLFDAAELARLDDEAQAAYEAFHAARKALFAHRPETMGDVRFLARALWQAAETSGRWYELPTRDFLAALCPELGEA